VENSRELFQQVYEKYGDSQKVNFAYGDSRLFLSSITSTLNDPAIFWLDSHWCGGNSYGETDQCPLLDELNELNKASVPQFILIDDARLFTAPPPLPNDLAYWPSIAQIIDLLNKGPHQYYVAIYNDVIIVTPQYGKDIVSNFLQKLTTEDWNKTDTSTPVIIKTKPVKTEESIMDGVKLMRKGARIILNRTADKVFNR
jgi:hypothetical protein